MNFDEYQIEASKTINEDGDFNKIVYSALGLAGEAGEVVDVIKKWYGQGHELDRRKIAYELGDVLWYINALCVALEIPLWTIPEANIAKLRQRYGEKFDADKSINRKDDM